MSADDLVLRAPAPPASADVAKPYEPTPPEREPVRHVNGSNAVYLDVEPAVPGRDVDENPRGRVLREVPPIDFVNPPGTSRLM